MSLDFFGRSHPHQNIFNSDRIDKLFDELQMMILSLQTSNAADPGLPAAVEKIRTKFKVLYKFVFWSLKKV